jgi:hypothetical protein
MSLHFSGSKPLSYIKEGSRREAAPFNTLKIKKVRAGKKGSGL